MRRMMRWGLAAWVVILPALMAHRLAAQTSQPAVDRATAVMDVYEAVLRYQFEHNASGAQQHGTAFFITVEGQDPTPEFLARFKNAPKNVLPGSKFVGGRNNLKFNAGDAKWIDDNTLDVPGGYYEGNLSSSGNVYRVQRQNGKWVVTSDKMLWIS